MFTPSATSFRLDHAQRAVGDVFPRLRVRVEGARRQRLADGARRGAPFPARTRAAVRAFRERGGDGRIGITLDLTVAIPASDSPEDEAAALRLDGHHNRWFLDPIFRGAYPADALELYEQRFGPLDAIQDGDSS